MPTGWQTPTRFCRRQNLDALQCHVISELTHRQAAVPDQPARSHEAGNSMSAQCRYYEELTWQEWQSSDERAAFYAANPRVPGGQNTGPTGPRSRIKTALEMKLAYARTGRRTDIADKLMAVPLEGVQAHGFALWMTLQQSRLIESSQSKNPAELAGFL